MTIEVIQQSLYRPSLSAITDIYNRSMYYKDVDLFRIKDILDSLDAKQKKRIKKTIQAASPTEFFGQDFTKLGELIDTLKELDLTKSDKKQK